VRGLNSDNCLDPRKHSRPWVPSLDERPGVPDKAARTSCVGGKSAERLGIDSVLDVASAACHGAFQTRFDSWRIRDGWWFLLSWSEDQDWLAGGDKVRAEPKPGPDLRAAAERLRTWAQGFPPDGVEKPRNRAVRRSNPGHDDALQPLRRRGGQYKFMPDLLKVFIEKLQRAAGPYEGMVQELEMPLGDVGEVQLAMHGNELWTEFFHIFNDTRSTVTTTRVYCNVPKTGHALQVMDLITDEFQEDREIIEAKVAGPGEIRDDRIVGYCASNRSAERLAGVLAECAKTNPGCFVDKLPPLVKRVSPGIGIADEPPGVEIHAGQGARHSFGTFYSTLCWIALKSTPNVREKNADGRHFLDELTFSMRMLQINPLMPYRFPAKPQLEQYYREVVLRQSK
jgi:hypothetical protein